MNRQISYNWLKEYLPSLKLWQAGVKTDKSIKEFARELSLKSMTVESIKEMGRGLEKVVVGKILEIEKHPNANRLNLAKVDIGRKTPLKLVFGQVVKLKVGEQLPVAVAPTKLPTGVRVKKSKIRGVFSEGMFCLDSELGLSNQDRVTFFEEKIKPGTSLIEALGLDDYLLNIEITSNRPDAMSVVGLAREAAAALGEKLKFELPQPKLDFDNEIPLSVEVAELKLCPRYQAVVMKDVKVGPSPFWLQLRLITAGLRPINNLVDITNYVLLEYGRPMHVFDYEKLNGQKIVVRLAKKGEKILALDGKTYKLGPDNLVIADAKVPVAVAGIMGGEESAAVQKTKTIVFESAAFEAVSVRKTARFLNLHSDASDLFEKNLHPETTFAGMLRAIELTQKLAGGKAASPIIDIYAKDYKPTKIKFDADSVKWHLGREIEVEKIKEILESLGFEVSGGKILNVTVPYWRANDVEFEYDLIEEIARIYGYHNLPTQLPVGEIPAVEVNRQFFWEDEAKNILAGFGFTEVYNYSMLSGELLKKVGFFSKDLVKISNPLNEEMEYMRPTLLAQILQNVADNQKSFTEQKIFELSPVYLPEKVNDLPRELPKLTGAILANKPFSPAKGTVESLLKKLGITGYELIVTDSSCPLWEKNQALDVYQGKKFLGQFGIIRQNILDKFGIKKSIAVFDFDFLILAGLATTAKIYQPIPDFPSVERDLAIVIDQKLSWKEIAQAVEKTDKLIVDVKYLSTFTDASLGSSKKSLAFRIVFRSSQRTLKSEEIDEIIKKLLKKLENNFAAKLR